MKKLAHKNTFFFLTEVFAVYESLLADIIGCSDPKNPNLYGRISFFYVKSFLLYRKK